MQKWLFLKEAANILIKKDAEAKMKKILFFIPICIIMFTMSVFAVDKISPAIDVIANSNEMVKAGTVYNGVISFDTGDFDSCLGSNVSSITIVSLPEESSGKLMLGNLYAVENQVIYREDFASLKFIPKSSDEGDYSFTFSPNRSGYEICCQLRVIKNVNYSPVGTNGAEMAAWTKTDISTYGVLSGYDPDGDELKFEIVSYPKKGLIRLTNNKTGDYIYTPYEGASGRDSFSYRVRDSYGNYSETVTVSMKIEKTRTATVFSDLDDPKSLKAAITVTENEIMTAHKNKDGTLSFKPQENITREEFIVLVMKAMGAKDVPVLNKTRFADDKDISIEYKGYIESAFILGIIEGERKNDGIYINPKGTISTAEAAVLINKIIGASSETSLAVFHDDEDIPDWARSAIISLNELGIISKEDGKINPNSPLTRAQTARILMSLLEFRGKIGTK